MPDRASDPIPTVLMNLRRDIPQLCVDLSFIESPPFFWQFLVPVKRNWLVVDIQ
jgi:hypothetical protein